MKPSGEQRFHSCLTLIARDGVIEHVFYPVFPHDRHADEVLAWLTSSGNGQSPP